MASVYLDTTIPSYYFETRNDVRSQAWRESTRLWWTTHANRYDLVISEIVVGELGRSPEPKRSECLSLLAPIRVLNSPVDAERVAAFYISERLMPKEASGDAMHLAIASLHAIDFLLTWNCRHLANANKAIHLRVLNRRLGLHEPIVCTPLSLAAEDYRDERSEPV